MLSSLTWIFRIDSFVINLKSPLKILKIHICYIFQHSEFDDSLDKLNTDNRGKCEISR